MLKIFESLELKMEVSGDLYLRDLRELLGTDLHCYYLV